MGERECKPWACLDCSHATCHQHCSSALGSAGGLVPSATTMAGDAGSAGDPKQCMQHVSM